jgi:hypothetical protein
MYNSSFVVLLLFDFYDTYFFAVVHHKRYAEQTKVRSQDDCDETN